MKRVRKGVQSDDVGHWEAPAYKKCFCLLLLHMSTEFFFNSTLAFIIGPKIMNELIALSIIIMTEKI